MLASPHRLRSSEDFRETGRHGRRAGARSVVVHLLLPDEEQAVGVPARVGLAVGKSVGIAVTRTRVKRRLRHQVRERLDRLPAGARVMVRALPPAATASSQELGDDLDRCLARLGERSTSDAVRRREA